MKSSRKIHEDELELTLVSHNLQESNSDYVGDLRFGVICHETAQKPKDVTGCKKIKAIQLLPPSVLCV